MHPTLEKSLLVPSRFSDERGRVDVAGLAEEIGLDQATLVKTLGTSRQTLANQFGKAGRFTALRNREQREFWIKLDRMLTLLQALTDGERSREEIRRWFRSPNRALAMERPIDLVQRRELERLIQLLMDVLNAGQGG